MNSLIQIENYPSINTPLGATVLNNNFYYLDSNTTALSNRMSGTVLFNGPDSNQNVTLSASAANYTYLEVFYRSSDNYYNSLKVYQPNNKKISLAIHTFASGTVYIKTKNMIITGSAINIDTDSGNRYSEFYMSTNNPVTVNNTNAILVTRVVGYN